MCVQRAEGDLLEAGLPMLTTDRMCGLLLLWFLCLKIYFSDLNKKFVFPEMYYPTVSRVREKSIPSSSSLLIGRVGDSHLAEQVPPCRRPWSILRLVPERRVRVASDLALGKPSVAKKKMETTFQQVCALVKNSGCC